MRSLGDAVSALALDEPDVDTIRGSVLPRIWTPPLVTGPPGGCPCGCALTNETSYGFRLIRFADMIGWPFDEWQRFLAIHVGELLPDGRPRFRTLLIIVARQNGKTVFARVLILFWMFVQRVGLTVATHLDRGEAKKSWQSTVDIAEAVEWLKIELPDYHQRLQPGEEDFWNIHDAHYVFKAPNRRAGRGRTINRAHLDELREHYNREAFAAVVGGMRADRYAQLVATSNQGYSNGVVLKSLREAALRYIATGQGDRRLGLIEWSAPEGSLPNDIRALAMANPDLNNRIDAEALLADAETAMAEGGEALDEFYTEYMCLAREVLNPAIDLAVWAARGPKPDRPAIKLADHRDRLAVCLDVSRDNGHVTLAGAAVVDGKVHTGVIAGWESTAAMRRELPGVIEAIRPRVLAWFPKSPTAAVMVELAKPRRGTTTAKRWPPRLVKLVEITSETPAVCMGFAEQIESDELRHDGHALGAAHVGNAVQRPQGELWVFDRRGAGHIDALYAMAGAVHEARALPPPLVPVRTPKTVGTKGK